MPQTAAPWLGPEWEGPSQAVQRDGNAPPRLAELSPRRGLGAPKESKCLGLLPHRLALPAGGRNLRQQTVATTEGPVLRPRARPQRGPAVRCRTAGLSRGAPAGSAWPRSSRLSLCRVGPPQDSQALRRDPLAQETKTPHNSETLRQGHGKGSQTRRRKLGDEWASLSGTPFA